MQARDLVLALGTGGGCIGTSSVQSGTECGYVHAHLAPSRSLQHRFFEDDGTIACSMLLVTYHLPACAHNSVKTDTQTRRTHTHTHTQPQTRVCQQFDLPLRARSARIRQRNGGNAWPCWTATRSRGKKWSVTLQLASRWRRSMHPILTIVCDPTASAATDAPLQRLWVPHHQEKRRAISRRVR
eukprot:3938180-Rhodomonas_salina.1